MAPVPERSRAQKIFRALRKLIPDATIVLRYSNPWELLVAVVLSAQCTDKKVNEVTAKLFKKYRRLEDYVRADPRKFEQDIKPTGFYRAKAKSVLGAARAVMEKFGGAVPRTMEKMLTLPGVGRKSANVILGNAYGVVEGVAVDTHVRRLAHAFGFSKHSDPEKIERDLMALFPKRQWFSLTYLLIEYGRRYCPARPHKHANCPLKNFMV